jgi:CHAD domain-containing protein
LQSAFPHEAYRPALEEARKALCSRQQLAETAEKVSTDKVVARVATVGEKIAHWHIGNSWDSVAPNLGHVYERGLEAFEEAYRHPSDEGFHEWRKAVKDLWYHLRILYPLWPKVMKGLAAQASTLADLLGNEHDLAVLSQTLAAEPKAFGGAKEVKMMQELIETHREEIRAKAWLLGLRLYADKPKRFTKRFEVYWRGWRDEREKLGKSKIATS